MPALTMELLPVAAEAVMFSSHSSLTTSWQTWRGISRHSWIQLYKNRSSRKIDSQRLFTREEDFPKTFSLTENQFSGKTYFYSIGPCCTAGWTSLAQPSTGTKVQIGDPLWTPHRSLGTVLGKDFQLLIMIIVRPFN